MNERASNGRSERGFTLVEIMVVIVIIGLMATIVAKNVIGQSEVAKKTLAKTNAKQIYDAATSWVINKSKIPTIEDLTTPDDSGRADLESEPKDPWDHEFLIRELEGRLRFEVISTGPDGIEDTDDDIVYPTRKEDN